MKVIVLIVSALTIISWTSAESQAKDLHVVWNVILPDNEKAISSVNKQVELKDDKDEESDVYWRPWKGDIPSDALIGAYKETDCGSQMPLYMVQTFHKGTYEAAIIPSEMMKKSKATLISYGGQIHRYTKNIKVLCGQDTSILTWVPLTEAVKYVNGSTDCVVGGTELNFDIFFGKTKYEEDTIIGKVLLHKEYMYFPYYSVEKLITKDFDILCYTKAVEAKRVEYLEKEEEKKKEEAKKKEDEKKKNQENKKGETEKAEETRGYVEHKM